MTSQNSHVRFYVSLIGSGEGRHTTHLLKCLLLLSTSQTDWKQSSDILSDISLSDISSDILSDISFDILSDISSDILSDISFDILSDISSDSLSDILLSVTFRGWGPARNTDHTSSQEETEDDTKEEAEKEKEEEVKPHRKSNNPHLTGGEIIKSETV